MSDKITGAQYISVETIRLPIISCPFCQDSSRLKKSLCLCNLPFLLSPQLAMPGAQVWVWSVCVPGLSSPHNVVQSTDQASLPPPCYAMWRSLWSLLFVKPHIPFWRPITERATPFLHAHGYTSVGEASLPRVGTSPTDKGTQRAESSVLFVCEHAHTNSCIDSQKRSNQVEFSFYPNNMFSTAYLQVLADYK